MKLYKSLYLIVLCIVALLSSCAAFSKEEVCSSEPSWETSSMFAPAFGNGISIIDRDKVKEGMTYEEIISLIGKP